ncbi:MAG: YbbR-like domain-containing protein [Lachnospiraceae bacterium]|jgi:YbbR domain-containing protein
MKKSLMNKFTLKIISVVVAFFIWLLVMTIEDPVMVQKITGVPVTLVNEDYIKSTGKVAMMPEKGNTVTVYVTGKTSVVGKLKAEDITAIADLQQIVDLESDPIMVPVTATCAGISEDKISTGYNNLEVIIDDLDSVECIVVPTSGDSKPGKGYSVGKMKSNPEVVTIRGPHSIVKTIDKVSAEVNVNNLVKDVTLPSELVIYDKNGDALSENQIKALTVSDTNADVAVDLWELRTDIKIEPGYTGEPRSGYYVGNITLTPSSVTIAGTDEALEEFEKAGSVIQLDESMISVEGKHADFETTIEREDVIELLPEGIKLVSENETFSVKVAILPLRTKEYSIPTTSIMVENKPQDMNLVYDSEKVTLRIQGRSDEAFTALQEEDIQLSIDVSKLEEGEHEVPVVVTTPDGFKEAEELKVKITLTKVPEIVDRN